MAVWNWDDFKQANVACSKTLPKQQLVLVPGLNAVQPFLALLLCFLLLRQERRNWCDVRPRLRAVFKWLSKVIAWLRLLRLVIGLKDSRQFFNQWEAKPKPKPIVPCTRHFSRALSELHAIARNFDWFIALSAPVVIGRSNCFGFSFSTVIWKPLYTEAPHQKISLSPAYKNCDRSLH